MAFVQEHWPYGPVEVILYRKNPLDLATLRALCEALHCEPQSLIRTKEKSFQACGVSLADPLSSDQWLSLLHRHPEWLQRPIIEHEGAAFLARTHDGLLPWIQQLIAKEQDRV